VLTYFVFFLVFECFTVVSFNCMFSLDRPRVRLLVVLVGLVLFILSFMVIFVVRSVFFTSCLVFHLV